MSDLTHREILTQFLDALVQQNLDTVMHLIAETATWHQLDLEGQVVLRQGHDEIRQLLQQTMGIFEPGNISREIFVEGDRAVVIRHGFPRSKLTGERVEIHLVNTFSFAEGQITEVRVFYGPELVTLMTS